MWRLNSFLFIFVSNHRPIDPINLCQYNGDSSIVMGFVYLSEINFPHVYIIGEVGSTTSDSTGVSHRYSGKRAFFAPAMSSSIRSRLFLRRTLTECKVNSGKIWGEPDNEMLYEIINIHYFPCQNIRLNSILKSIFNQNEIHFSIFIHNNISRRILLAWTDVTNK